jgi:hypothetical protein
LPSGLHLGHAKALVVQLHADEDSDAGRQLLSLQKDLFDAHLSMVNYALQHGHPYDRWKSIVTVMFEKDPGTPKSTVFAVSTCTSLISGRAWQSCGKTCLRPLNSAAPSILANLVDGKDAKQLISLSLKN